MTLRGRIVVLVVVTMLALLTAVSITSYRLLLRGFDDIERSIVRRNAERVGVVLRDEIEALSATAKDWSAWDETYEFVRDGNPDYIRETLCAESLIAPGLDVLEILDADGRSVYATGIDADGRNLIAPPAGLAEHLRPGQPLLRHPDATSRVEGILSLPEGLLLVSARPIVTSKEEGPIRGTLLLGRWLQGAVRAELARIARYDIEIEAPAALPGVAQDGEIAVAPRGHALISGYVRLSDLYGKPAATIRVDMDRDITRAGRRSAMTVVFWILAAGLIFGALMLWGIERGVLQPLSQLIANVARIRESADASTRVNVTGGEEWNRLGRAINGMLESIDGAQQDRRRAEASLDAEKQRLAVTLRSIGDGVIATDADGRIVLMNRVAEALTGWPAAEAAGRPLADVFRIVDETTRRPCPDPTDRVRRTGAIVGLPEATILMARDGAEYVIADSGAPIRGPDGRVDGIALVFRDITESRRIEEDRLRANKLESAGLLAAGIGHDFNNILTAILANVSLAISELKPGEELHEILSEAERASLRARDLTQQLLSLSRGADPVRKPVRIDAILRDAACMAVRGSNCRCRFDFAPELWPASADEARIGQVAQNLVINAVEATPEGGEIAVEAANRVVDGGGREGIPAGRYVCFSIADPGNGIPKENLSRIFDPYFTTKQKGSGLGLATCFSIVRQHGGRITVESQPGRGSVFRVCLPASDDPAAGPEAVAPAAAYRTSGRALLMDDEDAVCRVIGDMLRRLGFEVVTARDGREAIELYARGRATGRPFAVVLLDLTVPGGMGGLETLQQIREQDPDVCAVVSSGYSNDPVMSNYARQGFRGVLSKPYGLTELTELLRRILPGSDRPTV